MRLKHGSWVSWLHRHHRAKTPGRQSASFPGRRAALRSCGIGRCGTSSAKRRGCPCRTARCPIAAAAPMNPGPIAAAARIAGWSWANSSRTPVTPQRKSACAPGAGALPTIIHSPDVAAGRAVPARPAPGCCNVGAARTSVPPPETHNGPSHPAADRRRPRVCNLAADATTRKLTARPIAHHG